MSKFETFKVLTVSTLHISELTSELFKDDKDNVAEDMYGYFVWSGSHVRKDTPELKPIFTIAEKLGCDYVRIDVDGPVYDELRQF